MNTAITVQELQGFWRVMFPKHDCPPDSQFAVWLLRYDQRTVRESIARTAIKFEKLNGAMSYEHLLKFASATMGRLAMEVA